MKTHFKLLLALIVTAMVATMGTALAGSPELSDGAAEANQAVDTGFAASTYFTDEFGNRRNSTAEERAELSAQFQKDLARLAGKNRGKPNVKQHDNGAVSATVALSKLQFLVVQENSDGSRTFSHAPLDENGNVMLPPVNNLPEK